MFNLAFALIVFTLSLSSCARTEDVIYARYQPWIGRTIAEFTAETGHIPAHTMSRPAGDGRVYIYQNALGGTCRIIDTVQDGRNFRIVGIKSWCNN